MVVISRILCVLIISLLSSLQEASAQVESSVDPLLNDENSNTRRTRPTATGSTQQSDLSAEELRQLVLFEDIVVIQRRYFPKVSRFEFYPHVGLFINNPFYFNFLMSAKIGYHFNEYIGVEAFGSYIAGPDRGITNDLEDIRVNVSNVIYSKYLFGLALKWSPLYGKFAGIGDSILPFDMYFSAGAGMTHPVTTNKVGPLESRATYECETNTVLFNIETGQLIPVSKSFAIRWSLGWFLYPTFQDGWSCNLIDPPGAGGDDSAANPGTPFGVDIHFSMGLSWFFPEAKYR